MKIIDADKLEVDAMSDGITTSVECVTMEQIKNAPEIKQSINWILCSEQMPKLGQKVLASIVNDLHPEGFAEIGEFFVATDTLLHNYDGLFFAPESARVKENTYKYFVFPENVKGWLPIPEPIKREE